MFVLGTAGHVDHGKSSFLRALTGMEPDRLPEEKKRGMTIDLNFVWYPGADGTPIGIVDVPGHHRFVKNMISGSLHVDAFVFIVAADDGWMPQSEEHLSVLKSLGIRRGIALVTKTDLVEPERVDAVRREIGAKLREALGHDVPVLPFSTHEPERVAPIKEEIQRLLGALPRPRDTGAARLWVDRVFLPKGMGVVVTGTLRDGTIAEGDEVTLWPSGDRAQVKTLQSYQRPVKQAAPVARVAVQLAKVDAKSVARGMLLQKGRVPPVTDRLIARVAFFGDAPAKAVEMAVHVGTAHVAARIVPLAGAAVSDEKGTPTFCRLRLKQKLPLRVGERFVLRTVGEERTLGAGVVVDPLPGAFSHRRTLERLRGWVPTAEGFVRYEARKAAILEVDELVGRTEWSEAELREALVAAGPFVELEPGAMVEQALWTKSVEAVTSALKAHASQSREPLGEGELLRRCAKPLDVSHRSLRRLVAAMTARKQIEKDPKGYRQAGARPVVDAAERSRRERILRAVLNGTREPVSLRELFQTSRELKNSAHAMAKEGELVALGDDHFAARIDYDAVKARVVEYLKGKGQAATTELRDFLKTSRKNAVLWLEQLDRDKVTFLRDNTRRLFKP